MFKCFCLSFFLIFFLAGTPVHAVETPGMSFTAEQKKILKEIENYFNGIKTIQSKFTQTSSTGAFSEGTFSLLKPGQMRLEYASPTPIEVVADGYYLIFHDKKLEQITYLDIDSNPASLILKENFSFNTPDLTVTDVGREDGFIQVSLFKTKEPTTGKITLIFKDRPLALKQWQITDAQQVKTLVSLNQAEFNIPLEPKLFKFKDPRKNLRPGDIPDRRRN